MNREFDNNDSAALDRRRFLKLAGAAAVGGAAATLSPALAAKGKPNREFRLHSGSSDADTWRKVREAFLLDPNSTYMNVGTTGSMPKHVLANYDHYNRLVASNPWDMGGEWGGFPYTSGLVERIAPQFGANLSEIVLSRNTTDGMCSVIQGLNLKKGDEVLYSHHEHVAATSPLYVIAQRQGVKLTEVEIPVFPESEYEYVNAFADAVTNKTRLIVFSHITYKTGARLPARQICALARDNGIPTLVDGAHSIGMIDLDLHDIDCDFYAGSGHKWQCGPGATGILYVREGLEETFWPINSSLAEYVPYYGLQMALQYIGNDNYPAKRALADVCDMWAEIGRDRIEEHVLGLSAYCKQLIRDEFGETAVIYSPDIDGLDSGITAFNPFPHKGDGTDGPKLTDFRDQLREKYGYIVRTTNFNVTQDGPKVYALRISTHLFHDEQDVEGLMEAMQDLYHQM